VQAALAAFSAFGTTATPGHAAAESTIGPVEDFARLDLDRQGRSGRPEVVYAAGKTAEQVVAVVGRLVAARGQALASRIDAIQYAALSAAFTAPEYLVERRGNYPTVRVRRADFTPTLTGGHVGILTAGTSDLPIADEARAMAEAMGCRVTMVADVGVAGLHRLFEPLRDLLADEASVLIVAAGMDGALPSVVAGLATVPTIGLPTSVGYGAGGGGIAALLSMLQTCAPGLTVVNIDNGIGAGASAAMIANAVVESRGGGRAKARGGGP
jgi:NCAIR mutase (PurE)-related protein